MLGRNKTFEKVRMNATHLPGDGRGGVVVRDMQGNAQH